MKKCSENMQQICRRTHMRECDFNKVALELYWYRTVAWMFSYKFEELWRCAFATSFLEALFLQKQESLTGRDDIWKTLFRSIIFLRFHLYKMLGIVPSCNPVQYQGKLMQTWENGEKSNFELSSFSSWILPPLVVTYCSKLSPYVI